MKNILSYLGIFALVIVGLAILGLFIEHVVTPILYVVAFLIKWAMIIGGVVLVVGFIFSWISEKLKDS